MDTSLLIFFLCIFCIFGAGGTLFWSIKKRRDAISSDDSFGDNDAIVSDWDKSKCKTLSGNCGRGTLKMTRRCIKDGTGNGTKCADMEMHKETPCWINCPRPTVVDWGYPNDTRGIPIGMPKKGWYDISGQGQPNDYCRFVGPADGVKWSCQVEKEPYIDMDPKNIVFSAGPANTKLPYDATVVRSTCDDPVYLAATDPDLQLSIANGFYSHCGARCVYDHRNPKTGWEYLNGWKRVDDMSKNRCGVNHRNELIKAMERYDSVHNVKNAWTR